MISAKSLRLWSFKFCTWNALIKKFICELWIIDQKNCSKVYGGYRDQTKSLDGGKRPLISYFTFCSKLYMYNFIFSTLEMALKIF